MKKIHILSISQFNEAEFGKEFYVNTIENHIKHTHLHIDAPHKHDFYVTILFTQGSGTHEIDFESYDIKPGSLFFLNPGQVHNWTLSEDISGYIFFHTQSFFEKDFTRNHIQNFPFFYYDQPSPVIYLKNEKINYFTNLFLSVLNESKQIELYKAEKILTLIHLIYIDCAREYVANQQKIEIQQHTYVRQFKDFQVLVEENYKSHKSAAFYSDKLNISPKHLNRICQSVIGKTTTEYIIERVLLEAKREIIYQKKSLSEIAYNLGYEDYPYFSRIFKKHFNENPSEFINKYRQ
nr:helix-turn-helix transcriptional regulator [uncultured Flavobacterium sp.]